ncbi:hypothetical protein ACI8AC_24405 [Geodermatophilus sp. SYSU D00758]
MSRPAPRPTDPVADPVRTAIDGATGDLSVSSDAMRWSPELAEDRRSEAGGAGLPALPGLDVAAGLGALVGLDGAGVRRLVSGAVTSLATVAGEVVTELRALTAGPPEHPPPD